MIEHYKKDIYDEAIEHLLDNEDLIQSAWNCPIDYYGGCLFLAASSSGEPRWGCGCLTQIRSGSSAPELSQEMILAIQNDSRIPYDVEDISAENLHAFAEWQRKIDLYLGRIVEADSDAGSYRIVKMAYG